MGMDRKIEKKKGIRPKHVIYTVTGIAVVALLVYLIKTAGTSTFRADKEKITV